MTGVKLCSGIFKTSCYYQRGGTRCKIVANRADTVGEKGGGVGSNIFSLIMKFDKMIITHPLSVELDAFLLPCKINK
jgi:hypothetical protein